MSRYKGLFTFDEDNHRYIPIAQADGIIDTMDYKPGFKPTEPLIKDEKVRKAVRAWAEATGTTSICYWGGELESEQNDSKIEFDGLDVEFGDNYTIAELCGEEE